MNRFPSLATIAFLTANLLSPAADLDAINVTVNDTNPDPGDTVTVSWTAISYGDKYIGSTRQGVMWSSNTTISRGDTLLEKEDPGPLGGIVYAESSRETRVVTIPSNAVIGRTYYIGVYADYDRQRSESNENNNGSNAVAITIRGPDLDATNLTINDTNPDLGDFVTVNWTAISYGDIPAAATNQGVMLSTDNVITSSDTLLEKEPVGRLGGAFFESSSETRVITIPESLNPGQTYYLGVWADIDGDQAETNEGNNGSNAVAFTVRAPDLRATGLTVSTSTTDSTTSLSAWPGQSLDLSWTARNSGTGPTDLFDFSQQGVRWSTDSTVTRADGILEREPLGILSAGDTSPELRTVKVPSNVTPGTTYYLAVEADTNREFKELDEGNNFSNVIEVTIVLPATVTSVDLSDYNYLPYLEGEGLEFDDPRLEDSTGDGDADPGVTMNRSRCFAPGDEAYVHVTVTLDPDYTTLFNGTEPARLKAYSNTSVSSVGLNYLGSVTINAGSGGKRFNLHWDVPASTGDYYLLAVVEVQVDGHWYELSREWLDGGVSEDPVTVTNSLPVVLVHGWSDTSGATFDNLEFMIETLWKRPVRFFQYETAKLVAPGTGNGPRVDQAYTEIISGETKPSLAVQMAQFLADPEGSGDSSTVNEADVIAHSMGGLVARNYALRSDSIVRRMVTMGTPSYGGLFADTGGAILNNQAEDLEFGCALTWKLHREWKRRRAEMPPLLTIIGTNDLALGKYNQSDVVVTCNSASLEGLGFQEYYVPHPHTAVDLIGKSGIAEIDSPTHPSWAPVQEFLTGENASLTSNLPGYHGGSDDVGDRSHPEALRNGALYIVKQSGSGAATPVSSVNLGHTLTPLPIASNGIHSDGIYFANLVNAAQSSEGSEFFTTASSTVTLPSLGSDSYPIKVKAGETSVYVINDRNYAIEFGDLDGDLLPDFIEDAIIDAGAEDGYDTYSDVSPDGDYDGDGLSEILEAALGTNFLQRGADPFQLEHRDGFLYLRHDESPADYGLEIIGQRSADLDGWSAQGVREELIEDGPGGRTREWGIPIDSSRGFLRIFVRGRQ